MWSLKKQSLPKRTIDDIKQICKIVLIDDRKFKLVDILKANGWQNVSWIKDVGSLSASEIKDSHIVLLDIQGVGIKLRFKDEGLGLAIAIKEKYPEKRVIVYSSEEAGKIAAFHEGLSKADSRLSKNADPYEFERAVEKHANELFTLDECLKRIKIILQNEFGTTMDYTQIENLLKKLMKKKDLSADSISKVFNLQNIGNVATIIQLFLRP